MTTAIALSLATLPCLLASHWLISRLAGNLRQRGVCLLALANCAGIVVAARWCGGGIAECVYVLLVSLGVAYSYFHLFNMALTARRIHLLVRQNHPRSHEPYDASVMVERRLARLEQMGILLADGGNVSVKPGAFLAAARLLEKARAVFYPVRP